jgi:hypothetical protein
VSRPADVDPSAFGVDPDPATGARCLRALLPIDAGRVLATFGGSERVERASRYTVQADETSHLALRPEILRYVDHSCDPNVYFDVERMLLVSLRRIVPRDKLGFFYPATEWSMAEPFDCACGAPRCLGRIAGASALPREVLERYRLSAHVRALIGAGAKPPT